MTLKDLLNKWLGIKPPPPPPAPPAQPLTESQKLKAEELKEALEREAMSGVRWIDKPKK